MTNTSCTIALGVTLVFLLGATAYSDEADVLIVNVSQGRGLQPKGKYEGQTTIIRGVIADFGSDERLIVSGSLEIETDWVLIDVKSAEGVFDSKFKKIKIYYDRLMNYKEFLIFKKGVEVTLRLTEKGQLLGFKQEKVEGK